MGGRRKPPTDDDRQWPGYASYIGVYKRLVTYQSLKF